MNVLFGWCRLYECASAFYTYSPNVSRCNGVSKMPHTSWFFGFGLYPYYDWVVQIEDAVYEDNISANINDTLNDDWFVVEWTIQFLYI